MVPNRETLRELSRQIKAGEPIALSQLSLRSYDPVDRIEKAIITDVVYRYQNGEPQVFSGVSDDFVSSANSVLPDDINNRFRGSKYQTELFFFL